MDNNEEEEYRESHRQYNIYMNTRANRTPISYEKFMNIYYRDRQERKCEKQYRNMSNESKSNYNKCNTSSNYNCSDLSELEHHPVSEVDRQTLARWEKGESLQERYDKL